MPTPSERRALLFVAAVAALGLGVRGLRVLTPGPGGGAEGAALAAQIAAVDSAVTTGGRSRRARGSPAAPTREPARAPARASTPAQAPAPARAPASASGALLEPIDVDRATVEELDRLPGIGPALAQRIVAEREARGPFGSLEALQEVRGIGPALSAKLAPLVRFSGPPRRALETTRRGSASHP